MLTDAAAVEAALEPVLGPVRLSLGPVLPGHERNEVRRAVASAPDGTEHRLVLKTAHQAGDAPAREAAALRLLTARQVPGVARLVAEGADPPVLVLADAGTGPTVADALLGPDPAAAEAALLGWAGSLGALHAATTGLRADFARELAALSPLGAPPTDYQADELAAAAATLTRLLPRLGVEPAAAALAELRGLAAELTTPGALTPGDTCPDNAISTADGYVLVDFEGAAYRPLAWDAAYLRVPWPSCWCCWRLPPAVAERALDRWRAVVAPAVPAVTGPRFAADLDRATVGWAVLTTAWFLPAVLEAGDPRPDDPARHPLVPTRRALLQHRLALAASLDTPVLPALRELAARVHAATTREWGDHPLELAAAFRGS